MNLTDTMPVPLLPIPPDDKWHCEIDAFRALLPTHLHSHRDMFVAIHDGTVVEFGRDKLEVAARAYARFGYVPIFASLVTDRPQPIARIPTPRFVFVGR